MLALMMTRGYIPHLCAGNWRHTSTECKDHFHLL